MYLCSSNALRDLHETGPWTSICPMDENWALLSLAFTFPTVSLTGRSLCDWPLSDWLAALRLSRGITFLYSFFGNMA